MSAYLTEERMMIRDMARDFTQNEILPVANELDPKKGKIPQELIDKMGELGFFGIMIPEEYGGMGLGSLEYCMVAEEFAVGWMSASSIIARANSFYKSIPMEMPDAEEKIRKMAQGQYLGAMAISEPNAGSDVTAITTKAKKEGGEWVINGNKYWCTFADEADFIVFICDTEGPDVRPHKRLTPIMVEKPRGELPNNVQGSPIPKIGYFGWNTFELAMDGTRTPYYDSVDRGGAFTWLASGLEVARAHTAARSIGAAQGALNVAIEYAKDRHQFKQPISNFQSIRFKIATMATEIEAARQLMYHVCSEIDSGKRCDREASMVKYFAAEMSERVTSEALQILGGAGYTTHFPVERYWRDARLTKIFEGSSEIQQRIISDSILGKPVKPSA